MDSKVFIDSIITNLTSAPIFGMNSVKVINYPAYNFSYNYKNIKLPERNCLYRFEGLDYLKEIKIFDELSKVDF